MWDRLDGLNPAFGFNAWNIDQANHGYIIYIKEENFVFC